MNTVGKLLSSARVRQKYTLGHVEAEIKIKSNFLSAIEHQRWDKLPEYPVVVGFVKNYSSFLGVDRDKAIALLRRDYPPRKINPNPKPDLDQKIRWSPRITFGLGVLVVLLVISGYLVFQYTTFNTPPELSVFEPQNGLLVEETTLVVKGETDVGATVRVNGQPAFVDDAGSFTTEVEITEETREIKVVATSRAGKETTELRTITFE